MIQIVLGGCLGGPLRFCTKGCSSGGCQVEESLVAFGAELPATLILGFLSKGFL